MRGLASAALIAVTGAMALAGCAGGPSLLSDATGPTAATPELAMAGRWMLSAPNAPACGMAFSAKAGPSEGTVLPEGGCPERFYLSRHWSLDKAVLTISDDDNKTLATLSYLGDHFEGKSNAETPVTLAR